MGLVADLQMYLQGLSPAVIDGDSGWPSSRRNVHDRLGDRLVIFTEDGGGEPETPSEEGLGEAAIREPAAQVRVRAEALNGDAAFAKASELHGLLHGLMRMEVGSTYYMRIKAMTAEPVFIGFDEKGRPEHTFSVRAATGYH